MFEKIENEKDSKKLLHWTSSNPPNRFLLDGKLVTKQKVVANAQSKFYKNKVENIKHTLPRVNQDPLYELKLALENWKPVSEVPTFQLKSVSEADVFKMIKSLKNSGAYGHNGIDATFIKFCAKTLTKPVTHVINLSLGTGIFPTRWKISRIIPLLKSSDLDKLSPSSYRPVSQLSVISKLTEKALQGQLLNFLENTHQLSTSHHAYRQHLSTTTAVIQIMDHISSATDKNKFTATLCLRSNGSV